MISAILIASGCALIVLGLTLFYLTYCMQSKRLISEALLAIPYTGSITVVIIGCLMLFLHLHL